MQTPFDRLLDQFVADVTQTAQTVALESLRNALQLSAPSNGSPPKRTPASRSASSSSTKASGPRRRAVDRAELPPQIVATLRSAPGQTIGELAAALGLSTADLQPTVKRLIAGKQVRFVGQTRARKYFVAGGHGAAVPATAKATRARRGARSVVRRKAIGRRAKSAAGRTRKRGRGKR